ncbi:acyl-CoA dehydrogenase [Streptomyces sp. NRRL F-4489]|uniref:acyl-CoA dehydrogenase family protein n=1 Tax=Streptomyces sp. NRRL F-4489 TaxID=1609095 RepID=UPI000747455A|nr:acyl-CoA dehydrogenase family protein [Streptomyces sp. NRRL F-4489]KUL34098.1 acyl-CoA dehydrogenase [Streptomyces sp. NRRL F-4489]
MDAAFTEEQDEIRRPLRALLGRYGGPEGAGAPDGPDGYDRAVWRRLAAAAGLPGLALPAAYGGAGHGTAGLALACEETGRAGFPSPLIGTAALAAPLLCALGGERRRAALLPALAAGELTAALAVPGGRLATALALTGTGGGDWAGGGRSGGIQARWSPEPAPGAPPDGGPQGAAGSWRLYGEAGQVLDGRTADLLVVAAHTGGFARGRTLLFAVRAAGPDGAGPDGAGVPGLRRTRQDAADGTRPQAGLELRDVPAELLGEAPADTDRAADAVAAALAATGETAAACLAAEAAGAAGALLSRTAGRLRACLRDGGPAGALQGIRHRLAELYGAVESARTAAHHAARAADGGHAGGPAAPGAGALALAQALEALRAVAAEAVQLPGGPGAPGDRAARRAFARAAGDELLLGPVPALRARAAERAGLFGPGGDPGGAPGVGGPVAPVARAAVGA